MKTDRNREIVRLHLEEGLIFTEIADRYGITRERVRQIIRARGVPVARSKKIRSAWSKEKYYVDWECTYCGKQERRDSDRVKRVTCSPACAAKLRKLEKKRAGMVMIGGCPATKRPEDGHWYVSPSIGRTIRAERHLMEQHLGRHLRSDEWVTLKDRNPDNLDFENIEVITRKEAVRRRWARARGEMP